MNRYTIYCTEEQTKKALELGAPIDSRWIGEEPNPTAEQMIGWLEEQEVGCFVYKKPDHPFSAIVRVGGVKEQMIWAKCYSSRKEATLSAIDSALDYLIKNKK